MPPKKKKATKKKKPVPKVDPRETFLYILIDYTTRSISPKGDVLDQFFTAQLNRLLGELANLKAGK